MTRSNHVQKSYRRALAAGCSLIALATIACGSPVAGDTGPAPSPVTLESVRAIFNASTMTSANFRLYGTIIRNRAYFPIVGDGVLQLTPREALLMNIRVQTYTSAGVLKIQELTVGGRLYSRLGTGAWTSKPTKDSPTTLTAYVGEERLAGVNVWHVKSGAGGSAYDLWLREPDGYVIQMALTSGQGNFTMTFVSYNKGQVLAAPKR